MARIASSSTSAPPEPDRGRGRRPRVLVVVAADIYVRNVVTSGALDALDADVRIVASDRGVVDPAPLQARPDYVGPVPDPAGRVRPYGRLELILRARRRRRSTTLALKTELLPPRRRRLATLASLPLVWRLARAVLLRQAGAPEALTELIAREAPDLLLLPTGGHDVLVLDAIRAGRTLDVPTLALVHNWDGLSSKGALAVAPDHVAVWGEQTAEHAVRIAGLDPARVHVVGAPSLDQYAHIRDPGPSPFPFPYVLFAGSYAPFDERTAVATLDAALDATGEDVRLVYRPHPFRAARAVPDRVDPGTLARTLIDPAVRAGYEAAAPRTARPFPALDGYPALVGNARLVVTPLSTMMLEAALLGRPVLAIAYDDGVHPDSPARTVRYEHFRGLDAVPGITFVRRAEDLGPAAVAALGALPGAERADLRPWVRTRPGTYAERLAALVRACVPASASDATAT